MEYICLVTFYKIPEKKTKDFLCHWNVKMDGEWRGIWGLLGLLTLCAAFSTTLADEPEFLVPANSSEYKVNFQEISLSYCRL